MKENFAKNLALVEVLQKKLCKKTIVEVKDEVTSTNKLLKQLANQGESANRLMVAFAQTDGVGRYGRKFFSPKNSGLYFSLLITPKINAQKAVNVTVAMAVAVCRATEAFVKKNCKIKWVNDLLLCNKKVCGILTEGSLNTTTNQFDYVVVGVGINTSCPQDGFDPSIRNVAGDIGLQESDKMDFLATIVNNFYSYLEDLTSEKLFDEYFSRLAYIGEQVQVLKNGEQTATGKVVGLQRDFKLIVDCDGRRLVLDSGEISAKAI